MQPLLSVLILTVPSRTKTTLNSLLESLRPQCEGKPVEVLYLGDFYTTKLADKRNALLSLAKGKYTTFVDDDDRVAPDYVDAILEASSHDTDALLFDVQITVTGLHNGEFYTFTRLTKFSKDHPHTLVGDVYLRKPNHVMAIRSQIAKSTMFDGDYREDTVWAEKLADKIQTEHQIGKTLYFYESNFFTSETHNPDGSPVSSTR